MDRNFGDSLLSGRSPRIQLLVSLFYIFIIGGALLVILYLPAMVLFEPTDNLLEDPSVVPTVQDVGFLFYLMISQHISVFIIPGFILITKLRKNPNEGYTMFVNPGWPSIKSVIWLTICIFPLLAFSGELSTLIKFPEWLPGLAGWIKERELINEKLFNSYFIYKNFLFVILNIIMMLVLPALGEELIFRGVIQPILGRLFRSDYTAIIVTAVIFSALHLEFTGFLQRFILGALCGLVYLWSGNLWLPAAIHFTNNVFAVLAGYAQDPSHTPVPEPGYNIVILGIFMLLMLIPALKILSKLRKKYSPVQQAEYQSLDQTHYV